GELAGLFSESMGFQVAAAGIGRRIEVNHDRAFLERGLEIELKVLAAQAAGGAEIGCGVADLEGGKSRCGSESRQKAKHELFFHDVVLEWGAGTLSCPPRRVKVEFQVRLD